MVAESENFITIEYDKNNKVIAVTFNQSTEGSVAVTRYTRDKNGKFSGTLNKTRALEEKLESLSQDQLYKLVEDKMQNPETVGLGIAQIESHKDSIKILNSFEYNKEDVQQGDATAKLMELGIIDSYSKLAKPGLHIYVDKNGYPETISKTEGDNTYVYSRTDAGNFEVTRLQKGTGIDINYLPRIVDKADIADEFSDVKPLLISVTTGSKTKFKTNYYSGEDLPYAQKQLGQILDNASKYQGTPPHIRYRKHFSAEHLALNDVVHVNEEISVTDFFKPSNINEIISKIKKVEIA